MKKFLKIAGVVLAVIVLGLAIALLSALEEHPEGAPPSDSVANPAFQAQADAASARLAEIYRESMPPSLSVAVAVNGELVWTEAIGYAFLDDAVPAKLDSKYRIGSVSKSLTAAAAGVLIDSGKLDIEADFHSLVPSFPTKKYPFTMRQLGGHLAGIRHYRSGPRGFLFETYNQTQYDTVLDSLEFVEDDPLAFEPGTDFQYSSFGYNVFSAGLVAASGEPFLALMQHSIFEPLAMTNTSPDYQDRPVENVVGFYIQSDDVLIRSPGLNNSYKWAGGGFLSTPTDLVKFGSALLDDSLISRATRDLLWTPQLLANGEMNPQFYGVGFRIGRREDGRLTVSHGGSSAGGITSFVIFPEANVVVAVTSNIAILSSTLRIGQVAMEMAGYFLPAQTE